jgi:hypothetical protein
MLANQLVPQHWLGNMGISALLDEVDSREKGDETNKKNPSLCNGQSCNNNPT